MFSFSTDHGKTENQESISKTITDVIIYGSPMSEITIYGSPMSEFRKGTEICN